MLGLPDVIIDTGMGGLPGILCRLVLLPGCKGSAILAAVWGSAARWRTSTLCDGGSWRLVGIKHVIVDAVGLLELPLGHTVVLPEELVRVVERGLFRIFDDLLQGRGRGRGSLGIARRACSCGCDLLGIARRSRTRDTNPDDHQHSRDYHRDEGAPLQGRLGERTGLHVPLLSLLSCTLATRYRTQLRGR